MVANAGIHDEGQEDENRADEGFVNLKGLYLGLKQNIGINTLRQWQKVGRVRSIRVGRKILVPTSEITELPKRLLNEAEGRNENCSKVSTVSHDEGRGIPVKADNPCPYSTACVRWWVDERNEVFTCSHCLQTLSRANFARLLEGSL